MGWVNQVLRERITGQTHRSEPEAAAPAAPDSHSILGLIAEQIKNDTLEYNDARGPQFMVSSTGNSMVQVIPKQPPVATAVIEIDREGIISVTCPPVGRGIGRRGTFKATHGRFVSLGDFVGVPQPSGEPMTLEGFSQFVLEPILFPSAN
jgi:hypothetical protein